MTTSQKYQPRLASRSVCLNVRGTKYHLLEWGDQSRPLLVMLHGWGDCAASFQFVVDQLQGDWFIVAPDWRGFGQSQNRSVSYWFPDYLADLHEILDQYTETEPAHILGHSMGANVAGLYAGVFPDRVQTFVNVEGFGLADSDPRDAPGNYRRWISKASTMPTYTSYSSFAELAERILKRAPNASREVATFVAEQWGERGRLWSDHLAGGSSA